MPVTIQVAKHDARGVLQDIRDGCAKAVEGEASEAVLKRLAYKNANEIEGILNTRLGPQTSLTESKLRNLQFSVQDHGLVRAAYYAYSAHHHLVLRPEDIWFAILTQFSFFVNAHAEELRSSFVAHKGKKGLILRDPEQPDMGLMCRNMTKLIEENIVDKELREWILPSFTTTTVDDEVISSVIMMGTLQRYFDYVFDCSCCGIPSVTLLGEQSDWEDIQRRIEKLTEYGEEPTRFCGMLRPILNYMVASFTAPPGDEAVVKFWGRIIDRHNGSGTDTLTGWMVAFCFWDEDGKSFAKPGYEQWAKYEPDQRMLDDVVYHSVEYSEVPAGFVTVPVTYVSPDSEIIETKLLAGFVGFESVAAVNYPWTAPAPRQPSEKEEATSKKGPRYKLRSLRSSAGKALSKLCGGAPPAESPPPEINDVQQEKEKALSSKKVSEDSGSSEGALDTLRPLTGWWMYKIKDNKNKGKSRDEFYQQKIEEWNGQASTGYVARDGTLAVEEGLPRF